MTTTKISFESFYLEFMTDADEPLEGITEEDECDYGDEDNEQKLERMESLVPDNATFLGELSKEVSNWTTWEIHDSYYLLPIDDDQYEWALFRISWDDNWETYAWRCDARMAGIDNANEAAFFILTALFKHWGLDLESPENRPYTMMLSNL